VMKFPMRRKRIFVWTIQGTILLAVLSAALIAAPTTSPAPIVRQNFRERYGALSDHNIFLRERRSRRDRDSADSRSSTQHSPEQVYVLTGIVLEGGQRRAYVEDRERGGLVRLSIGDSVARGKVADIDIDSMTYDQNGARQPIAIGADLTGSAPVIPSFGESVATTNPTTLPFDPNSTNLTQEQKMQLRRFQELNKKQQ
jgi:hypothetical protein